MKRLTSKPREFVGFGANFMTPNVLSYWRVGKLAVEISQGEGIRREPIFGVTVKPDETFKLSKMVTSLALAMHYLEELEDMQTK